MERDDPRAAEELLSLVYEQLRELAAHRLAREQPGQSLQATALVHEAYLRLIGNDSSKPWDGRGHFFAAAAEAMRRILIDRARDRKRLKRGGKAGRRRLDLESLVRDDAPPDDLIDLDESLTRLAVVDTCAAELVSCASSPVSRSMRRPWPWASFDALPSAIGRSPEPGCYSS
jgi:RNA polymerase sigma factor (TIGR02999 family)